MISVGKILAILCTTLHVTRARTTILKASADTSIRRDRSEDNYGSSRHLTVINRFNERFARAALIKFDTSDVDINDQSIKLRLFVADLDKTETPKKVIIHKLQNDFNENEISWDTFDHHLYDGKKLQFEVHNSHVNSMGQVDVTSLYTPGEDLKLAIYVEGRGFIKFVSKDHDYDDRSPYLVFQNKES